jgi:tetratricopeptide (TPR) repeat protein
MAVLCLLIGVVVGYFLRSSPGSERQEAASTTSDAGEAGMQGPASMPQTQPTPEQMRQMADTQAAPLIDLLKSEPNNPQLLIEIGNMYYDARQYQPAIDYYSRLLKIDPNDANVRTDMGTAYFYIGDADRALKEFEIVLKHDPSHVQTLYNMGLVKWQGKSDVNGAVAAWQKLLQIAPDYPDRAKVQQLIDQARKNATPKLGSMGDRPTS